MLGPEDAAMAHAAVSLNSLSRLAHGVQPSRDNQPCPYYATANCCQKILARGQPDPSRPAIVLYCLYSCTRYGPWVYGRSSCPCVAGG